MLGIIKKHKGAFALWVLAILIAGGFGIYTWLQSNSQQQGPQATTVTKTTLTQIINASGQIDSSGQTQVTTSAGGTVKEVYVKVGDTVKKGDKILEITPDLTTVASQQSAWTSYLSAKNTLSQAQAKLHSLEAAKIAAEQKFNQEAVDKGLSSEDAMYKQLKSAMLAAQAEYANQNGVIAQAKSAVTSAYTAYQKTSSVVLAPADGKVQDILYEKGALVASSSSSTGGAGGTAVGMLKISERLTASVKVSELDIANIKNGQDVALTLTALTGKTYHGKVISISSAGTTESNITTFEVIVEITDGDPSIRVGMAVSSDITTQVKENVLALVNQAIATVGDKHTVTVLKDGKQQTVEVTVGLVLDTQSEIVSGLAEGDKVVMSSATSNEQPAAEDRPAPGARKPKE